MHDARVLQGSGSFKAEQGEIFTTPKVHVAGKETIPYDKAAALISG